MILFQKNNEVQNRCGDPNYPNEKKTRSIEPIYRLLQYEPILISLLALILIISIIFLLFKSSTFPSWKILLFLCIQMEYTVYVKAVFIKQYWIIFPCIWVHNQGSATFHFSGLCITFIHAKTCFHIFLAATQSKYRWLQVSTSPQKTRLPSVPIPILLSLSLVGNQSWLPSTW